MGQRSRKRGRREKPPVVATATATAPRLSRGERKNAAVRATLTPLSPGERPWVITVGALLAALNGLVQLILFAAGVKLKVAGTKPQAFSVIVFAVLMFVCAGGMWKMRYWAVLGFQALLAIVVLTFGLVLIRANNILGLAVSLVVVVAGGFLFFKMVRVLSRLQMPKYPGS
ncbi:MAG TPA: hypothetical protein VMP89_04900 [Solirubrobacteraceae bacterium]|nr:hypothetical protein [Solirubrobacteraceae bacterium]